MIRAMPSATPASAGPSAASSDTSAADCTVDAAAGAATAARTKARALRFAVGASLAAVGALAAAFGLLSFLPLADESPSVLDVESNAGRWDVGAVAFVAGTLVLAVGTFVLVRALRPSVRVGVLLPLVLAVGGLFVGVPCVLLRDALLDFVMAATPGVDMSAWDLVELTEPLLGIAGPVALMVAAVGVVWSVVVGIVAGVRRISGSEA
jgi:hypothetical protein